MIYGKVIKVIDEEKTPFCINSFVNYIHTFDIKIPLVFRIN